MELVKKRKVMQKIKTLFSLHEQAGNHQLSKRAD